MAITTSHNSLDSQKRRQKLQTRRNLKFLGVIGRCLILGSMSYGLFWLISLPNWVISSPSQLEVVGNHWLSQEKVKSLTGLSYPQSLWELPTQQLRAQLKSTSPIADAVIMRRLLPARLKIKIEERQPVAMVVGSGDLKTKSLAPRPITGFLDREGVLIPYKYYDQAESGLKLPNLKVVGFNEQNKVYWSEIYHLISESNVAVYEIDWQNPNNLIFKTDLGVVYLGANPALLSKQLKVIERMAKLPSKINLDEILYLDLTNPDTPFINLVK